MIKQPKKKEPDQQAKRKMRRGTVAQAVEDAKEDDPIEKEEDDRPKKRRKMKHRVLESGWGCIAKVVTNLTEMVSYAPQPQRQGCRLRGNRLVPDTTVVFVPVPEEKLKHQDIRKMFSQVGTASSKSQDPIYSRQTGITFANLVTGTPKRGQRKRNLKKTEERREEGYGPIHKYFKHSGHF